MRGAGDEATDDLADDLDLTRDMCPEDRPALLCDYPTWPWSGGLAIERGDAMERDHVVIRFIALGDDFVALRVVRREEAESRHGFTLGVTVSLAGRPEALPE